MRRYALGLVALLIALGVIAAAARKSWRENRSQVCAVCRRPVHQQTRAEAVFEGHRDVFCCPACALTAHRQSGRPVRLLRFTDFDSGVALAPGQAYLVSDSDFNLCMRAHLMLDEQKHAHGAQFDRCAPSILAFATRSGAERFAAVHGGRVESFQTLSAAFAP